ncbi:MAG: repeat-containing protein, partial [Phycisphaerales bacterium]|nr:repeat-containing protein [Phycisphaerales bacterium]
SGALATFTDTQNPAGGQANVGNYTASVSWGNNSFVPATVTADTNPSDPNGYVISATSANLLSNPDTLIVTMVQYAASSGLQGRPASLGEPVVSVTPAVSDLGAVAISTSEIDLSWTVNATNATAIEVDSSIDGVTYTATMLDPTATSYRDTGLTEGSHHYYEVRAIQSVPSAFAGPLDLFAIPMVPGLTANTVSSSTIDLTWGAATSPGATGVQVWRSSDGVTYSLLTTLAPDATNYTDTGVPEATPYLYQVRVAEGSASSASDTVYAITIPAAPTGLTATADGGAVDLSWADNSQNESAYNIYRSTDDSTFTLIDTVPPNTTAYIDTGAPDGSTDYYQVSAADDGGESGASSVASATPVPPLQLADDPAILVGYGSPRADYTVLHGHTLSILDATDGVLANDTDPNGWTLSVASYTQPSHGVLTLNSDGTFTYAAAADFTGQDTFTYTATDDIGATGNTAAVTINVTDQMPEAASDVVTLSRALGPGGTPLDYAAPFSSTLTASDADGDPLTYSLVSGPTSDQGTFVFSTTTGAYTFTPNPANMQMGTLNVVFKVTDGALTSNLGDVIFAGYTITDNSTRNAMDSVPLPIAGGANQSWSTVENSALEYGPPGLLFGAADNDTVTPDPDVPVIDSGLIESPQHGQVSISTSDGSFYYQPNAGFVGRDWFTYRLLDGSKPSDYATIFIDVLPLNISLSVGDLQPGDPAAKIPTLTDGLPTGPFVQLHLNNVNSLPQGSTVTLSMNSDVVPDLNVSSLQPGSDGNVQFIGHDAGTNTHTWTVGVNSPPTYVWASGLTGTDYDQVLFHLTAQVAPTITGSPTVAAPPASQPIVAAQNATVLGKGGYLAAFDGTWDYPEQDKDAPKDKDGNPIGFIRGGPWNGSTVIYEFAKYHYASPNVDYHRGVGNALDHKVVGHLFLGAFGAAEANAFVNAAYDSLATFYTDPNNRGIPVDIIGYSRGAYEAAWLAHRIQEDGIPDLNTKKTVLVWVTAEHGQRKQVPKVTYQYVHPQIRWVGLVSPVNQMGPLTNWPSTLPPGVVNCFEALDNDPNNIIYLQIPITCATGTNLDQPAPYPEGHPQIGIDPKVLNDMISDAKKAGVPVK